MLASYRKLLCAAFLLSFLFIWQFQAQAQAGGSTSVTGSVVDPSGAVVPNASVEIGSAISGFSRTVTTDSNGKFSVPNVPFNTYHLAVSGAGFAPYAEDVRVYSTVPISLNIQLNVKGSSEMVTVEADTQDLLEKTSTFHTDVDRGLFDKLPLESTSSSVSSLVTLATPGVAADSNGLFHGLGDHAENSFSVDGQPITDQQSKVFSNQIPLDAIQSMEVISGAPPAEFGEKTSVVINVTTRSGQGLTKPTGNITASYGSFGTANLGFNLGYGGKNWGNFVSANGMNTGRFLDPPEFAAIHDRGNQQNLFDRLDFQINPADSLHVNLGFTRSWFQTPNAIDNLNVTDQFGNNVGSADQRSQIRTFNIAPSWIHLLNNNTVLTVGGFVRRDLYNYYPSNNPLADLSPLQQESVLQDRKLTNAGLRSDISYAKGIHNIKAGVTYQQTYLDEDTRFGIVDPLLNAPCLDLENNPVSGFTNPADCAGAGLQPNISSNPNAVSPFLPYLGCYDLTRPTPSPASGCSNTSSTLYPFLGHTDVKLLGMYVQDAITKGNWSFNVGIRGDLYNGLTVHREAQPRVGVAYNIKKTGTVLRVSYARLMETPFNENLVLASTGCASEVLSSLLGCVTAGQATPFTPGWRNEFHAGLQQAFGKYVVFSGEYIWKYTHNAYDFSVLGSTPITFPIEWNNSKIPGFAGRVSVPNFHGISALMVFSGVSSRFFTPQVGGAGAVPSVSGEDFVAFRIDHDEKFNQTTHVQYQPWKTGPWMGFNWRYDNGLVAGEVPVADANGVVDLTGLTADQQLQAGLYCGSQKPTLSTPLGVCTAGYGSTRIALPAPGTEDDDKNPPRIAPRHLFDLAIGHDNLFHGDKYKWSLQLTAINLTNKVALYNFLSTFSGTHFVTPRSYTVELGFSF
ncbi:MAG: TonB-dependent receptor [Acidobacteria bacterium]|nr:TonB-dependent receptor [Acidobacteriota bacterium]